MLGDSEDDLVNHIANIEIWAVGPVSDESAPKGILDDPLASPIPRVVTRMVKLITLNGDPVSRKIKVDAKPSACELFNWVEMTQRGRNHRYRLAFLATELGFDSKFASDFLGYRLATHHDNPFDSGEVNADLGLRPSGSREYSLTDFVLMNSGARVSRILDTQQSAEVRSDPPRLPVYFQGGYHVELPIPQSLHVSR
jgi:hypothetical protein